MDAKTQIKQHLNDFLVDVAGSYTPLVTKNVPPIHFKRVVSEVTEARDLAEENIIEVTREAIAEAIQFALTQTPVEVSQLVPADVLAPVPETQQLAGTTEPAGVPEGLDAALAASPLPRLAEGDDGYREASPAGGLMGGGAAPPADEFFDPYEEVDHPEILETIVQERRREAGLPTKPLRPTIHVDHTGKREQFVPPGGTTVASQVVPEAPKVETTPIVVDDPQHELTAVFQALENIMVPHIQSKDKALMTLACTALPLISQGKGMAAALQIPEAKSDDTPAEDE